LRTFDATLTNPLLLFVGPTAFGNALAGKIDDRINAFKTGQRDTVMIRTPFNLIQRLRRMSYETENLVAVRL
jgi:hypothetical protein